jgi:hypothetical protein
MADKGQFRVRFGGATGATVNLSTASYLNKSGPVYVKAVTFKLVTTATAGNRKMRLQLLDEALTPLLVWNHAWATSQAASTTGYYQAFAEVPTDSAFVGPGFTGATADLGVATLAKMDDLILFDNWTLRIIDAGVASPGVDGADQIYANIFLETR